MTRMVKRSWQEAPARIASARAARNTMPIRVIRTIGGFNLDSAVVPTKHTKHTK